MASTLGRRSSFFAKAATIPFLILIVGFGGYSWAQVVVMAFSHLRIESGNFVWTPAGLDNFRDILTNEVALYSLAVTTIFVVATVALSVVFGLVMALLVQRSQRLNRISQVVLLWPAIVAPVVVSLIWLLILSPNIGVLNKLLDTVMLPTQDWLGTEVGAIVAIIIVDVWHWTPVAFLMLYTALCAVDEEAVEAARCDGANEWQVIRYIKIPMLMPAILGTIFIRAVMGVKAFDEMYLLTAGGPNSATTLVSLHIRDVFFDQLNYGYGSAFSVLIVALMSLIIGVALVVQRLRRNRPFSAARKVQP
ncbi:MULTISPECIES: sugar ABC transporter permease [unclassified Sinorhizobium]|uniref:carbohydrate ABC transporter permease n=1 Tax=unclassified Sinorhizobium TaxID=2613772 RepID=UPI0024C3FE62|nr:MULTISPECIES: sugar ABC transporter permease [unclassified Sinorhizobium]MDK1374086.1 sugar ABC transporter permease [Sinorhizobium sp. 6-70]MDK1477826.1 sugar ABC transporter permease [Sinorhizobium sp. 6-117]